jgi:hypothetical protein
MDKTLDNKCTIRSISSINPEKNIKLNRIEFLFLLSKTPEYHNEAIQLYKEMLNLQNKHNLKINSLIIDENDFYDLITSDEINPLREALSQEITFFCPQTFWSEIKQVAEKTEIKTTAILLQDDARLIEAIPIILAKNSFKSNLMTFLSQKFETAGKLLGLLKILQTIKPKREINETIDLLETLNTEEIPADEESVLQNMRLYNAL